MRLRFACLAAAVALPMASPAQPVEKNGLPCVAEICLGDGLEELGRIDWKPAMSPRGGPKNPLRVRDRRVETADRSHIDRVYRGVPPAAAPWLADRAFDREGLAALAGVKAACAEHWAEGTFTSSAGNPTTVTIKRLPDDAGGQRWTVFAIRRQIVGAVTPQQRDEAHAALRERYAAFDMMRRPRPATSQRAWFDMMSATQFGFRLTMATDPQLGTRLRAQPACGGSGNQPAKLD